MDDRIRQHILGVPPPSEYDRRRRRSAIQPPPPPPLPPPPSHVPRPPPAPPLGTPPSHSNASRQQTSLSPKASGKAKNKTSTSSKDPDSKPAAAGGTSALQGGAAGSSGVGASAARWHHHHPSAFTEGGGFQGISGASATAFVAMLGSSLQPPAPAPGPTPSAAAPASPAPSSCHSASPSAAAASVPSPASSPFHHHPSPHPHHPHAHHHPSPHHYGGSAHRATGGLRVPWPPPASNHPPEGFGRFGGGLYSLFPAPAATVANSPVAEAVYSPSPSPSSPAASPAGTPFTSADHYHSFIAAQKESLFSSTFSFNGGAGSLVGAGLQAHFSTPHVGLLTPATGLERGITQLEMMAKKGFGVDKPPSSEANSSADATNKMSVSRDVKEHHQRQQRRGNTSSQHWPEVRFIMPKSENVNHAHQQQAHQLHQQQIHHLCHDPIPSPADLHNNNNNNRRRGSKRRWPETTDMPEANSAKMEVRSACACHRALPPTTSSTTSTATTILTVPTSLPISQVYQPRGSTVGTMYHPVSKGDAACRRNGSDPATAVDGKAGGVRVEEGRRTSAGNTEGEEEQRNQAGGCSRTTPVALRCPRDSSTPTHGARSASSTPQSPLALHHHQQQQQVPIPQGPHQAEWGGGGMLQLQVTVKKETGTDGTESAGTTPCQVAEVTTSRSSAEGANASNSNGPPAADPNPIAALSQMPLLCMSPNAVLLKSIKVEEGPMPPSPGVVSPTTTSTTPVECAQAQTKDCNGRQTPVKRQQHSKSKKDSMPSYAEVPLTSTSNSMAQVSIGAVVGRQRVDDSTPRLAPLSHVTPVSLPQLEKRPEAQQAPTGGLLLVRGADHQKGRVKGVTDMSQTPSTPTLTVSAPSAMVAPVPACNPPSAEQLTTTSISASAIAAPGAVLQPAPCEEAAAGEVAAAVAAAVANGMHSWAGPAPLHHSPALTPPHHLHHHHTLWLGQGQTFPAPVPLQLGASQAQAADAQHVPLPPVGYQLVRDPLTGQLLLIPATNLAEHLQRAAAAAAAAVVWPSFPSALPPHASATSPHLHQLMLQQPQQPQQQHIQLFPGSQHPQQPQHQAAEHHQTETEYRILFQHQIQQQHQQQHHQSHQLQQQTSQEQTLVIPPVHDFVKKKEDGEGAPLVGGHASAGILIAVPKVEVVEPEEDESNAPISVDDVKPGIGVTTAPPTGFLHPHQPHLAHNRRPGAELLVPSVAAIGTVVSPAAAQAPTAVATSASFPPFMFPASIASAVGASATPVAAATAVTTTPAVQYFYEHAGMVRMAQTAQPSAAVQTESGRRSQGTSPVNPADTCLTPPPETPCATSEGPDETDVPASRGANAGDPSADSEMKPSSSSTSIATDLSTGQHGTRAASRETEQSANSASACTGTQEMEEPAVQVQDAGNQTEMTMGSDDDSAAINASSDEATNESTQHASAFTISSAFTTTSADVMTSTDSQDASAVSKAPRLVVIQPPLQSPPNNLVGDNCDNLNKAKSEPKVCTSTNDAVDVSGLELLSNSIEQFESNRTQEMPRLERHETRTTEPCDSEADDKAKQQEQKADESEMAPRLDIEASLDSVVEKPKVEPNGESPKEPKEEDDPSGGLAGGLGLLCALAEQRFMEEVARSEPANQASSRPVDSKSSTSTTASTRNSVDVHRNYKSPKSEREIKAFIASKVSQYQGQNSSQLQPFQYSQVQQNLFQSILNSNSSGSGAKGLTSSPFTSAVNGGSTSAGSSGSCSGSFGGTSDVMDAMELDMRMRLAELQRKYREKQRELSRLQHSRTKATGDEATTASGAESCAVASSDNPSPTKRGPGRPRKQTGKKAATPSLNSAIASSRRGSSSSSGSSCCGGISPQKELSPPVLEKVTEVMALRKRRRRRQRKTLRRHHKQKCGYSEDEDDEDDTGEEEDGGGEKEPADAAPRLRLASKEILKPPTLTANRIINCARFKPEETPDALSSEASIKAFKLPQCNVNLVKLKASTIAGRVKASELTPALPKAGTSSDAKGKIGGGGVTGGDKLPNGPSLLVSASSASGASWLARNTQNNNSYITTSNTSDHNKNKAGNISNNDSSSLSSPFHRNSLLSPSSPSPLNGKALLAPSTLRIPSSVTSVRKQSLSCYTFGSKQLTPSLLSSGEKQRLESLTSDSSMLWFLKPDSDASKEPAVGVGGFSPSQKAEEKRTPPPSVVTDTTTTTTTETTLGSSSLANGRKRKTVSGLSQTERTPQQQSSPPQSLRSSPSSLSSSSSSSSIYSSSSSSPALKKRKPGRPKKHSTRSKTLATETIVAKKLKKKSVVGFIVGPPAPSDPPTDSRAPLAPPTPSTISAPASPATASTAPLATCPSPHKPKIKPKLKAEAKVKSSLSCDDEDDWIQLPPSIPSPLKGRRRVFDDASSAALPTASSAASGAATAASRTTWSAEGCPPSLGWSANSTVTAAIPNEAVTPETAPPKSATTAASNQQMVPRSKKKLTSKGKLSTAKKKAQNHASNAGTAGAASSAGTVEQTEGTQDSESTSATEKRRRSGERAATTQDLLRSLKKRQTRTQSAGGALGANGSAGNASLSSAGLAAKVTVRSRSFADNHESSSYSEGENVPLIALKERPSTPVPRSCKITQEDLHDSLRALTSPDGGGLLYAGQINAIQAPDIYGITLDGERGHRPHIYSREEILNDTIAEVRPGSIRHLQPGTRVCAYWSQQYRCLYPGTVAAPSSPDPELDRRFISVEFDDGDSGRININDIRLLPQDFPIVDYDPNPLMSLARRRRRASGASASGALGDGVVTKDKKEQPAAAAPAANISNTPAAPDEASTSAALPTCDSSLTVSKAKKRKREAERDGDSTAEQEIRKKSSYWKEMEKTMSASSTSASNSGSALVEADSSGLPMPGTKTLNVTKKLTAAEKEKRRMRKREKARKRDKLRRQQLLAAKIAATSMNCEELSGSPGSTGSIANPMNSDLTSILKKKHKKHRSNKCDEKCLLLGKKHRHHHHHRKHHRHHHHKHRHHRRGSRHCIGSTAPALTSSGDGVSSEPSAESMLTASKVTVSSPVVLAHTKRKKKKKKADSKVKEAVCIPVESTLAAESVQTGTSDSNEALPPPTLPPAVTEPEEAPAALEVAEENAALKEECAAVTPQETVEAAPKKTTQKNAKKDNAGGTTATKATSTAPARKQRDRQPSVESRSKMAAFLPARQLWRWSGRGFKRPGAKGRGKKEFYKSIQRGKETIKVGDCAVFLSTGRPDRPYIGSIESMWESWGGNMVVRVKWFYHPEETKGGPSLEALKFPGALFQSPHVDENDVQTISHKCEVLGFGDYRKRMGDGGTGDEMEPSRYASVYDNNDVYYLAGHYDPTNAVLTMESDVAKR